MSDSTDGVIWLTASELAERWQIAPSTLTGWRQTGRGPRFARFGNSIRYRVTDIEQYEEEALSAFA